MSWFKRSKPPLEASQEFRSVLQRLDALEFDYLTLKTRFKRLMTHYSRIERIDAEKEAALDQDAPAPTEPGNGGRTLTPRQMQIQQQILRRRAGL